MRLKQEHICQWAQKNQDKFFLLSKNSQFCLAPQKTRFHIFILHLKYMYLDLRMFSILLLWHSTEAVAFFFLPVLSIIFPACSLVLSRLIYWETLSALLFKLKNYGFDQLVSQRLKQWEERSALRPRLKAAAGKSTLRRAPQGDALAFLPQF